ncbi:MAG TPA: carboxylating nicotinate-nucleotide diphosphorylase [Thermoplasmata archaeon]|nr:carboxylating nicotinate-nucleotide diphosphorylase [Thermoplasmata archaeon]
MSAGTAGTAARSLPLPSTADATIRDALVEDRVDRDLTTAAVVPRPVVGRARVVAQASGTVAGVEVAVRVARAMGLRARGRVRDGARVRSGTVVVTVEGDARRILSAERTLLNFLMHLSGVATATRAAVEAAGSRSGGPRVFATRKTIPGLRDLEKWAVAVGGGFPHRRDLSAAMLVKNNHLQLVALPIAVTRARMGSGRSPGVQVEVRNPRDALTAVRAGANALLLDNQSPASARRIVAALEHARLRKGVWVELSGGITPRSIGRYRAVGADAASLGSLTHSAPALPFHLTLVAARHARPRPP